MAAAADELARCEATGVCCGACSNGRSKEVRKENDMELLAAVPDWLVWCAAGGAGALALTSFARILAAALDLEAR
jgi:hypothetical protein